MNSGKLILNKQKKQQYFPQGGLRKYQPGPYDVVKLCILLCFYAINIKATKAFYANLFCSSKYRELDHLLGNKNK